MTTKKIRYAFDLGTNSIGWAVFSVENNQVNDLLKTGVRIFSDGRDPKKQEPLAVSRRVARGSRKRRDRFLKRKATLLKRLIDIGLMPKDENERQKLKSLDVYFLRSKSIKEKLQPFELGRILYHLNQRRGFKSNRKSDNKNNESKLNAPKISKLHEYIKENKLETLGNYLYSLNKEKLALRFKPDSVFYPDRSLYEKEFDQIVEVQSKYLKDINQSDWERVKQIIFYQRPLKIKTELIGKCELFASEIRYPRASVYFQRYRLLQSLANLKIINEKGEIVEIDMKLKNELYRMLSTKKELSFDSLRKKLKLGPENHFNLENNKNKKILGDNVSKDLKDCLGKKFEDKSIEELDQIVSILESNQNDEEIIKQLESFDLTIEEIEDLLEINLPAGYCFFSKKALEIIVPKQEELFCSPELIIRNIRGEDTENILNKNLEYYGKILPSSVVGANKDGKNEEDVYGKISNPTVHIALNQLSRIANELISMYGLPDEVILEVTRDLKNSKSKRDEINKIQNQNQKENERIREILISQHDIKTPTRDDITKYKLWEELGFQDVNDRKCPYTLKNIPASKLFSDEIEVEHILPFSRTLDDSISNKTLSYRTANKKKGNSTPFEAFGAESELYEKILTNSQKFPRNKKWRFIKDAMGKFSKENDFLSRQLNDTAYIAKISKKYLESICGNVYTVPGKLTSLIRHHLGLNTILNTENFKDREKSSKHHAVDAVVVGIISRSYLQKIANQSKNNSLKIEIEPPFENFREIVKNSIDQILVSRKEDHGIQAQLHEDTYYGIIKGNASKYEIEQDYNLVRRKNINEIKEKNTKEIRSVEIRKKIQEQGFDKVISELKESGTKRLRLLKSDHPVVEVYHPYSSKLYLKGIIPGDNHSLEVWKVPKFNKELVCTFGKIIDQGEYYLVFVVYSYFEKANKIFKRPHPAATKLFTLCKGDNVAISDKTKDEICYLNVKTIRPSNNLIGAVPLDSSTRKDEETVWVSFSHFKNKDVKKIKITSSGKVLLPDNPYV